MTRILVGTRSKALVETRSNGTLVHTLNRAMVMVRSNSTLVHHQSKALVKTRSKGTLMHSQKGPQAPGKDLVVDQGTPQPEPHSVTTKSGTTATGRAKRRDRPEQNPGDLHHPLVSSKA